MSPTFHTNSGITLEHKVLTFLLDQAISYRHWSDRASILGFATTIGSFANQLCTDVVAGLVLVT